jgi:hypothetical protein
VIPKKNLQATSPPKLCTSAVQPDTTAHTSIHALMYIPGLTRVISILLGTCMRTYPTKRLEFFVRLVIVKVGDE